jgi:hypothetical protein
VADGSLLLRQVQGALGPTVDCNGLRAEVAVGNLVEGKPRIVREQCDLDGFLDLLLGGHACEPQLGAAAKGAVGVLFCVVAELEAIQASAFGDYECVWGCPTRQRDASAGRRRSFGRRRRRVRC